MVNFKQEMQNWSSDGLIVCSSCLFSTNACFSVFKSTGNTSFVNFSEVESPERLIALQPSETGQGMTVENACDYICFSLETK